MAQQRCTAADAFAIVRTASLNRNIKLHQVAEQIVTGITGRPRSRRPSAPDPETIIRPAAG
jgi:ANTAR domain-containing protein